MSNTGITDEVQCPVSQTTFTEPACKQHHFLPCGLGRAASHAKDTTNNDRHPQSTSHLHPLLVAAAVAGIALQLWDVTDSIVIGLT